MEKWRDVVGYEGVYEVSSIGRIKRIKPGRATNPGKILKPNLGSRGRLTVALTNNGVSRSFHIHCLVALAFLGDRPPGKTINHIDYDKLNNNVDNLEYITHSENILHAYQHGFVGGRGERQGQAKLTEHDVRLIRKSPLGSTALGLHYGVARGTIKCIRNFATWKQVA